MRPPVAKQVPYVHREHGRERPDPYMWMRSDERDDPEVLAHLSAENAFTEEILAPLAGFRDALFQEIIGRIAQDDTSVPYRLDGFHYYQRFEEGKEYPIHARRRGSLEADEEITLDVNQEAQGHAYYQASGLHVSDDGLLLAYGEDTVSRRVYTLRVRDLERGARLGEAIEGTSGQYVWAEDNRTIFYTKRDPRTLRTHQVWRHRLGAEADEDRLVFDETNEEFHVSVSRSRSRELIFIGSHQTISDEYRWVRASEPDAAPVLVIAREPTHEYNVDHAHGRFYIRTNWEARDFRLMSVRPDESEDRTRWREEIPARDGVFLESCELFSMRLVVNERRDGILRLSVMPWRHAGRASPGARPDLADLDHAREVPMDEAAYWTGFGTNAEFESDTLRFQYTSMRTPRSVYDLDLETFERTLMKRDPVLGDFDPERYATHRLDVRVRDGALVPVSLVHRRDLWAGERDAGEPRPLLLYGYGSYGHSLDPTFSSPRLSLLDRGVVFAIAHVRGGQERGRAWYDAGRLLDKMNTFRDFIDVADHLVDEGWTSRSQLFAHGGSAGGLLMGAVANMAPDRFAAIVADVPFVDVVTTMLDESIPLTTFEYDEWGNPNRREFFEFMLGYSPYDNVGAQDYPSMLVITGLHDSQVQYWEPAKWVARLRERKTDDNLVVFHVNLEAGHGGASGRFRRHRETALSYAFLLDRIGVRR